MITENSSSNIIEDSRDNRELVDNNEAQNLTGEEIEAMRRLEDEFANYVRCIYRKKNYQHFFFNV